MHGFLSKLTITWKRKGWIIIIIIKNGKKILVTIKTDGSIEQDNNKPANQRSFILYTILTGNVEQAN